MRIGLLSDVHGNLAALRAVVEAFGHEPPLDHVIVAGDLLQGGPRPREVWQVLRELGWTLLRGNEDEALTSPLLVELDFPPGAPFRSAALKQFAWSRAVVGPVIISELAALPASCRLETPAGELLVVHASPRSTHDRCGAVHNSVDEVIHAYGGTGAAVIAFGHYHRNMVRMSPVGLLINVASVGLPITGQPFAAYTILTAVPGSWSVEQRLAPYDAGEEVAAARANALPPWAPEE